MEFSNPFKAINLDRQLTKDETESLIRLAICAEHEAVALYRVIANNSPLDSVRKIFDNIADEEVIHIGELTSLLQKISSKEQILYKKGFIEVEKILGD